jgi:hypothetical protein
MRRIGPKGFDGIAVPLLCGLFVRSPWQDWPAAEFWKRYDKGEFKE